MQVSSRYHLILRNVDFILISGAALLTYFLQTLIDIYSISEVIFWIFVLACFINIHHFFIDSIMLKASNLDGLEFLKFKSV